MRRVVIVLFMLVLLAVVTLEICTLVKLVNAKQQLVMIENIY